MVADQRGQGCGAFLMRHAALEAQQAGSTYLQLEKAAEGSFFTNLGFAYKGNDDDVKEARVEMVLAAAQAHIDQLSKGVQ